MLGWRDVPVDPDCLGASARAVMPICRQLFIADAGGATGIDLDRKVFIARKRIEHELPTEQQTYFPSLSGRTLIYKGMLTTPQLRRVLPRPRRRPRWRVRWRWCTAGSAPTRSRRGRWPTRTDTSPTTARSTPCRATATGCVPASRCWPATLLPGTWSVPTRSARRVAATRRRFDEVLELLHLGGRRCRTRC